MNVIGWGLCREVWEEGRAKGWVRGFKEPSQREACLIRREDTPRRGAAVCKGSMKKQYSGLHLKTPSWWGRETLLLPSRSPWGSDGDAATVLCLPATVTALSVGPTREGLLLSGEGAGQSWESGLSPGRQCWPGDPGPLFPGHFHE